MTSEELIAALKIRGSFPTSDDLFSNSDFLVLLNTQMQTEILPMMLMLMDEYFLLYKDYTIASGGTYRLPRRAIGSKIRDIQILDANNNITHPYRWNESDRDSNPSGYFVLRNSIELSSDYTSGTLRIKYFARPNKLVLSTSVGQITSINTGLNQVVVSSIPSTITTSVLCDFVQANSPYDLLDYDNTVVGVSGTTVTMTSLPTDLSVGDYLTIANESCVPMIPEEMHPVLLQSALVSCLSSKKDKSVEYEYKVLEQMKMNATRMLDPRVEGNSQVMRSGKLLGFFQNRWY